MCLSFVLVKLYRAELSLTKHNLITGIVLRHTYRVLHIRTKALLSQQHSVKDGCICALFLQSSIVQNSYFSIISEIYMYGIVQFCTMELLKNKSQIHSSFCKGYVNKIVKVLLSSNLQNSFCVSLVNAITMSICGAAQVKFYTTELNRTVTIMFPQH